MKLFPRAVLASLALIVVSLEAGAQGAAQVRPAPAPARPAAATPAALPAGITRGPTVEGITEYRLANGLRVILFPDPSKPTVTVNITYLVGSRQENYGETGMAHLLEHLIFKGSKNFPKPDVEFNRRGFQNNASTWLDRTNYFSTFQASDDNLKWAIDWSADAMVNSFIAKKDLDSEMTVVRNEFEMGKTSPSRLMFEQNQALLYDWHNYGKSTIGARSDIEHVRIENLQAYYRTYYQPDNAVLIIAGKFDEAKALQWVAEAFGRIPRPKRTLPVLWTEEPTHDGERQFTIRRKGEVQMVTVAYRIPSSLHPDVMPVDFAVDILSDTPNGRLHKALVETGKAAQIFGYNVGTKDPGFVIFGAIVKKGEPLEPVAQTMIEVIETSFAKQSATDAEMRRTLQEQKTSFERALANPQAFGIGLSEYIALGDWRLFFYSRDRLQKMTSKEVDQAAARYFVRDNRVVGFFIPEDSPQRADIPSAPAAAALLADYRPATQGQTAEAFDPSQQNIDKRTRVLSFGDLKVALLSKRNRGEIVNVRTSFRWGDATTLSGRMIEGELAGAMLARGTDKMTRQQIADEMTRLQMTGGLLSFQTTRSNLPAALKLLADVLRNASFPAAEYQQLQRELVTALSSQLDNPETLSRDVLSTHFNTYPQGDPRFYIPLKDRIDAIGKTPLDAVKRYYGDFYGTARGEISIVGDFDETEVEALLKEQFANWVSKAPFARVDREYREVKPVRLVVDAPDKENAVFRARQEFALRDDDADAAALVIATEIIGGGGGLSNRLVTRLRQKEGLSYGVGAGLALGSRERLTTFTIGGIAAPQNVNRAEQALREELERARKDGFTAAEVEDAKNGLMQSRLLSRSQDPVVASAWISNLDLGRTFEFSRQFEDKLRAVTPEQASAAFRKYIDPAKMSFVIAGDAKKGVR
ncbi:MAG TPA: pitrilysin family protein [Burkholderiaceae bacterium]|nr:pitrilysin family protein [Burkholderiaceae bacterium]